MWSSLRRAQEMCSIAQRGPLARAMRPSHVSRFAPEASASATYIGVVPGKVVPQANARRHVGRAGATRRTRGEVQQVADDLFRFRDFRRESFARLEITAQTS